MEKSATLSNCMMLQNDLTFNLFVLSSLLGRGHHQFETRDTVVVASEAATPTGNGTFSVQPLNSRKNSANPFLEPAKRHSVDMKGRCTYSIQRSIISLKIFLLKHDFLFLFRFLELRLSNEFHCFEKSSKMAKIMSRKLKKILLQLEF